MIDCPHGERCSGCTQLGVPYPEQLERKRLRVLGQLGRHPELSAMTVAPTAGAEPCEGYRTRAKWMVGPGGELGLYARQGGHEVVDVPGCRVVAPAVARAGQALRGLLSRGGWLRRSLRAVDLRELRAGGASRVLVTLVVEGSGAPPLDEARAAAAALAAAEPAVAGVALNVVPPGFVQVLGPTTVPLLGVTEAPDEVGPSTVRATFGSFVQAHRGQAAAMQGAIAGQVAGPVLELYGGSGSLGLAIAARGVEVESVESFGPASRAASAAARAAGVPLTAVAQDAGEAAAERARARRVYGAVVMNPPRRGVPPGVRAAAAALGAGQIAYMSCEPATLARDLAHLARLGYGADEAAPYDMIPQTDEVETLVFLRPRPPAAPRVLLEVAGGIFVEKPAHEPVTAPGREPSLLGRLRAQPGYEGATAVQRLPAALSGVVLAARSAGEAAAWGAALAAGQRVFMACVRGLTAPRGSIGHALREGGRVVEARTRYRRRGTWAGHTILEVTPEQDRPHQIEKHLADIGHPVLGDERHGHGPTNRHLPKNTG